MKRHLKSKRLLYLCERDNTQKQLKTATTSAGTSTDSLLVYCSNSSNVSSTTRKEAHAVIYARVSLETTSTAATGMKLSSKWLHWNSKHFPSLKTGTSEPIPKHWTQQFYWKTLFLKQCYETRKSRAPWKDQECSYCLPYNWLQDIKHHQQLHIYVIISGVGNYILPYWKDLLTEKLPSGTRLNFLWKTESKIDACVTDNASNKIKAVDQMLKWNLV